MKKKEILDKMHLKKKKSFCITFIKEMFFRRDSYGRKEARKIDCQ